MFAVRYGAGGEEGAEEGVGGVGAGDGDGWVDGVAVRNWSVDHHLGLWNFSYGTHIPHIVWLHTLLLILTLGMLFVVCCSILLVHLRFFFAYIR